MANYRKSGKVTVCTHENELKVWETRLPVAIGSNRVSYIRVCTKCGIFRHFIASKYQTKTRKDGRNVIMYNIQDYMQKLPFWYKNKT